MWRTLARSRIRELFLPLDLWHASPLPDISSPLVYPDFSLEVQNGAEVRACVVHPLISAGSLRLWQAAGRVWPRITVLPAAHVASLLSL